MIRSFNMKTDTLIHMMTGSAVIGIGISFSDFYLFHFFLFALFMVLFFQLKSTNFQLTFENRYGNYDHIKYSSLFSFHLALGVYHLVCKSKVEPERKSESHAKRRKNT